ncbi:hypothetical protein [Thauera aminoaromatica]|uniref:Uncharacterized protein n=1 Tax=Thauera aminoaromatica TaxID=164330 RepID=A0A5C7SRH1_THASP|nr:hypothetical protein [Thauera aminoaromatica]TXH86438.1 MAG: hypothetical protein E6Q80_07670 [Thauera aminoaromatica]
MGAEARSRSERSRSHLHPAELLAQALEALAQALEALAPALEVLDRVDENLCTAAKPLIIVKTLNRTRANKGFYYDEKHCKPATRLDTPPIDVCTPANIDGPRDIDHPTPVIDACRPRETGCRLAMLLIIVKTLVCTRAIKGFYYDERLCRRAKVLVDRVENLERWLESLERLCENLGGLEMGSESGRRAEGGAD